MHVNPITRSIAITPSDTAFCALALPTGRNIMPRGILVGSGGTVVGVLAGDWQDQWSANQALTPTTAVAKTYTLSSGEHPMSFTIVKSTGTTATGLFLVE